MDPAPTLQQQVATWHAARFPTAAACNLALKAVEELGEVAEALNAELVGTDADAARGGTVAEEAADVVIVLLGLLGRFYPTQDLLAHVEAKLAILQDPASGHRSSTRPPAATASAATVCHDCGLPIVGGKGDWWHAATGDMRCDTPERPLARPVRGR